MWAPGSNPGCQVYVATCHSLAPNKLVFVLFCVARFPCLSWNYFVYQADLELTDTCLPLLPKCRDQRCMSLFLAPNHSVLTGLCPPYLWTCPGLSLYTQTNKLGFLFVDCHIRLASDSFFCIQFNVIIPNSLSTILVVS